MSTDLRPYELRAQEVFPALGQPFVLPKGLARSMPQLARVPRFVAEFLLARQLPKGGGAVEVAEYLARRLPSPQERELWQHRLVTQGSLAVVDLVEVRVDVGSGSHRAYLDSLGISASIRAELADRHPSLMTGGLWGHATLRRSWDAGVELTRFVPVQAVVRLDQVLEGRLYFETADWVDLLLASAGYDPYAVASGRPPAEERRLKLLYLVRLAPLVEPNLNLIELGPKNTGKTYLLRNVSPRAHVVSGGRVTPASLFVNLATGRPGLLADRKVVVFDEVARLSLGSDESVATLKDFLESGTFGRGAKSLRSECSVLFTGNIEVEAGRPSARYRHLFEPLPQEFRDSAFIDRLHGFIPGWELPKLTPASFAQGIGFVSDFFGEVLFRLRQLPYERERAEALAQRPLLPGATQRDSIALERLSRALLKMVFPLGAPPDDPWLTSILDLAGELRQLVHDQLSRIAPGEFSPRPIGYETSGPRPHTRALSEAPSLPRRPRAGEVFYLDFIRIGEGWEVRLRKIQAAVIPSGKGLRLSPTFGADVRRSIRAAFDHLEAHPDLLGLPSDWFRERSLAVDVPGEPLGDGSGAGLAAFLAMAQAALHQPAPEAIVALGVTTLHGDLTLPEQFTDRLAALPPGPGHLVVPRLPPDLGRLSVPMYWRLSTAMSLSEALTLAWLQA